MSKMVQMRVRDSEWAVITLGAKQRQMTMTGFIKEAVLFYLGNAPKVDPPKKDRFDMLLEMLDKGPKYTPTKDEEKRIAEFRAREARGEVKGIGREEAMAMLKRSASKRDKEQRREANKRLIALGGSDPNAKMAPRKRYFKKVS